MTMWRRDLRAAGAEGGRGIAGGVATRLRRAARRRRVRGRDHAARRRRPARPQLVERDARGSGLSNRADPLDGSVAPGSGRGRAAGRRFTICVLEQVASMPGVESASVSSELFVGSVGERVADRRRRRRELEVSVCRSAATRSATDSSTRSGRRLLRGRLFSAEDGPRTERVAIVNEAMASRIWPGRDPIGRRFTYRPGGPRLVLAHRRRRRRQHAAPGARDRAGAADLRGAGAESAPPRHPVRPRVARRPAATGGAASRRRRSRGRAGGRLWRRDRRRAAGRDARGAPSADGAPDRLLGRGASALDHRHLRADSILGRDAHA